MFSTYFSSSVKQLQSPMAELCLCLKPLLVVVHTTWTPSNAGRRFTGCANCKCQYFRGVDPLLCDRARLILPGLMRRINHLEEEKKQLETINLEKKQNEAVGYLECSTTMKMLLVTWVLIVSYIFCNKV